MDTIATRNGTTIELVTITHDDWSQAYEVKLSREGQPSLIVPSWRLADLTDARIAANAAYRAAAVSSDLTVIRASATAEVRR